MDQAKAEMGKADLDVNRLAPWRRKNAVPQQDLDNAVVAQVVGKSNVEASRASYENVVLNQKVSIDQAQAAVMAGEARSKTRNSI